MKKAHRPCGKQGILKWGNSRGPGQGRHSYCPCTLQGVLNWVGQWAPGHEPDAFEARLYDVLFRSEDPADADDWLADLNPDNLEVVIDALATPELAKAHVGDRQVEHQMTHARPFIGPHIAPLSGVKPCELGVAEDGAHRSSRRLAAEGAKGRMAAVC